MKPATHKEKSLAIAYDASRMDTPAVDYFQPDYWRSRQSLIGEAVGRGSAWFIDTPFGAVVLREYLRGGWVAKFSRDRYFYSTISRSRPFREFHILAALYQQGLPVPRPVAALCEHRGIFASGSIMTACISAAQTLADVLPATGNRSESGEYLWTAVGKCIRRFHDAGVWHADLNARNILLDSEQQVFLIDFDRARFTPGKAVNGKNNLSRLNRSLAKLWPAEEASSMQAAWAQLESAYHG
jgi:3-deoxy-D-manno-octulosonic acid kinase